MGMHWNRSRVAMTSRSRVQMGVAAILGLAAAAPVIAQTAPQGTQIVFLGTGTPKPDPERSGPATAIVVNGTAYLVDFGPGIVRRAAAARAKGIEALDESKFHVVFVTHLHSDHTVGYPDLIFTSWVRGRSRPLEVFGPSGLKAMTKHVLAAWREDIRIRTEGMEGKSKTGYQVNAHEIEPGIVFRDENVLVKAFLVRHGEWRQAFGYRFETPGRTVVISGDTAPAESIVENCNGCDVLIHEVYSVKSQEGISEKWRKYSQAYHTSSKELAEIVTRAKPKLLLIYHRASPGRGPGDTDEQVLEEMRPLYSGKIAAAHDLDIY
jgi:ribonuclease BN (tRNA processing enzyme)